MPVGFVRASSIWTGDSTTPNQYAEFFAQFDYEGGEVHINIAAESHFAIYLNGEYVYAMQYADYPDARVYECVDLSALAVSGENALSIIGYCANRDLSVGIKHAPYVRFEVFEDGASKAFSGAHTPCAPCAKYISGDMELISNQLGYTFRADFTRADAPPSPAVVIDDNADFYPRPVKPCALEARHASRRVSQGVYVECAHARSLGERMQRAYLSYRDFGADGLTASEGDGLYVVYDLGEECAGLLDIEITLPHAAEVLIGWGEHLTDLRVRASIGARNFCASAVLPAGHSAFIYPFRRVGARYLQLHIASRQAHIYYAGVRPTTYPLPEGARMELEDALDARIYAVCARTLVLCMHEHYEDCPWREQALYAMDSRNQMLAGYYAFGEYAQPRASLELLMKSLRADGLLELCAPARVSVDIPSFSAMFVVALWEYVLYSGDYAFAREALPAARAVADGFISRICINGLIRAYTGAGDWNFYEWSPGLDGHLGSVPNTPDARFDAPLNAFVILALDRMASLMNALGDASGEKYARAANQLRTRAHEIFYDAEREIYHTYVDDAGCSGAHELTQALMLYAGVCPERHKSGVMRALTGGKLTPITLAYTIFKYEALLSASDEYSIWVRDDIRRLWGGMLFSGATSFWETEKGDIDFERAGSLCHGWSAVPAYLYFAYGVGIKPSECGFQSWYTRPNEAFARVKSAVIRTRDGRKIYFEN